MVVQHNLQAMNANRMLGINTNTQAKSTEKLSSGYKINRAADDAAGLSISEKMRKQIRGLTQASSNAQDGISAVQTAEGALTEVQDMLQRMNELAVKSANSTNSESDRDAIQAEIDQLVSEIDRVSETTKFNETYLLRGDKNAEKDTKFSYKDVSVLKDDLYYLEDGKKVTVKAGTAVDTMDSTKTYYSGTDKIAGTAIDSTNSSTYIESTTVITATDRYIKGDDGNFYAVKSGTVYDSGETYYTATAGTSGDGKVNSQFASVASDSVGTNSGAYAFKDGVIVYDSAGKEVAAGTSVESGKYSCYYYEKTEVATSVAYNGNTEKATVQFVDKDGNEIAANGLERYLDKDGKIIKGSGLCIKTEKGIVDADQSVVDSMVDSSAAHDVGAVSLKLHVGADATTTNQISVEIEAMSADRLGLTGLRVDGADDTKALNAIETIKEALNKVSDQRSALGAIQNRLEHTITNLDNVVENTTSAESQIRDTDMATEMVKYSNNNILAQAGQAMLAQANQSNQGVLSLLG